MGPCGFCFHAKFSDRFRTRKPSEINSMIDCLHRSLKRSVTLKTIGPCFSFGRGFATRALGSALTDATDICEVQALSDSADCSRCGRGAGGVREPMALSPVSQMPRRGCGDGGENGNPRKQSKPVNTKRPPSSKQGGGAAFSKWLPRNHRAQQNSLELNDKG